ncbi:MAG: S-layer homology domain-containing protein [Clostridia bacterium]|nr:S-layer homology domain-containing protein [Clostridia bacterium]
MKRCVSLLLIVFMFSGMLAVNASPAPTSDPTSVSFQAKCAILSELGILEYQKDKTTVTRAEMLEIIARLVQMPEANEKGVYMWSVFGNQDAYTRVSADKGDWFSDYMTPEGSPIRGLMANGFLLGDGDGKFRPDDVCTYGEMVVLILRALGYGDFLLYLEYPDGYVQEAVERNLIPPVTDLNRPVPYDVVVETVFNALFVESIRREAQYCDPPSFVTGPVPLQAHFGYQYVMGEGKRVEGGIEIDGQRYDGELYVHPFYSQGTVICIYKTTENGKEIVVCTEDDLNFVKSAFTKDEILARLHKGMTYDEMVEAIGEPTANIGSGLYIPAYFSADKAWIRVGSVLLSENGADFVHVTNPNGETEKIAIQKLYTVVESKHICGERCRAVLHTIASQSQFELEQLEAEYPDLHRMDSESAKYTKNEIIAAYENGKGYTVVETAKRNWLEVFSSKSMPIYQTTDGYVVVVYEDGVLDYTEIWVLQ